MTLDQRLTQRSATSRTGSPRPRWTSTRCASRARANRRRTVSLAVSALVVAVIAAAHLPWPAVTPARPLAPSGARPSAPDRRGAPGLGRPPVGGPPLDAVLARRACCTCGSRDRDPVPTSADRGRRRHRPGRRPGRRASRCGLGAGPRRPLEPLPVRRRGPGLSVDGRIAYWDAPHRGHHAFRHLGHRDEHGAGLPHPAGPDGRRRTGCSWRGSTRTGSPTGWTRPAIPGHPVGRPRRHPRADRPGLRPIEDLERPVRLPDLWVGFEDAYVSPDGTREVFTGPAPGDSPRDCCADPAPGAPGRAARIGRARRHHHAAAARGDPQHAPVGRLLRPGHVVGVVGDQRHRAAGRGRRAGHSYLVRCSTTGGACELVFDLGPNSSKGILYMPDWERDWAFARFPVSE